MFDTLMKLRVNFVIVFLGAFALMFLIKLTSLLPSQYYFSFSKLIASDRGPFIVDPPSVTGAKLCELLRKNNISTDQIGTGTVDCRAVFEERAKQTNTATLAPEAQDRIYGIVLRQDAGFRAAVQQRLGGFALTPLTNEQLDTMLAESRTASEAYDKVFRNYEQQLSDAFRLPVATAFNKLLGPILRTKSGEEESAEAPSLQLSAAEADKIRAAHQVFLESFAQQVRQISLSPIRKSTVDEFMSRSDARWALPDNLAGYYGGQIKPVLQYNLKDAFQKQNIALIDQKQARATIFREMAAAGLHDYLAAVGVRLLPVILFGLVFGFVFGRAEFTSTSLAAAMTAFLLSWPLILMWEQLVTGPWQSQRQLFIVFYAVYVLSFFFTARMAAVFGAWMRQRTMPDTGSIEAGGSLLARVSAREILVNIAVGLICNGAVYTWNVAMPRLLA